MTSPTPPHQKNKKEKKKGQTEAFWYLFYAKIYVEIDDIWQRLKPSCIIIVQKLFNILYFELFCVFN